MSIRAGRKIKAVLVAAIAASAFAAIATPASADSIDGGDVYDGGCHGYVVKDAPHYAYAVVTGNCEVQIDSVHGPTWTSKGWQKGSTAPTGSVYIGYYPGDAVIWGAVVCISPNPATQPEKCGSTVYG